MICDRPAANNEIIFEKFDLAHCRKASLRMEIAELKRRKQWLDFCDLQGIDEDENYQKTLAQFFDAKQYEQRNILEAPPEDKENLEYIYKHFHEEAGVLDIGSTSRRPLEPD